MMTAKTKTFITGVVLEQKRYIDENKKHTNLHRRFTYLSFQFIISNINSDFWLVNILNNCSYIKIFITITSNMEYFG